MKSPPEELRVSSWPYGLTIQSSEKGLLLLPRKKARAGWAKAFRQRPKSGDELAAVRLTANHFDHSEWEW